MEMLQESGSVVYIYAPKAVAAAQVSVATAAGGDIGGTNWPVGSELLIAFPLAYA